MLWLSWGSDCPRRSGVRIEYVDHFDARGMKLVYGRCDGWIGRREKYRMDIWRDQNGLLFARFWSQSKDVDGMSIVIHGIPLRAIPNLAKGEGFVDDWIPKIVREEYAEWIESEW